MVTDEIRAAIDAIANDASLLNEASFRARAEARDALEFHVLDRLEGLLTEAPPAEQTALTALHALAETVRHRLEAVDAALFARLRAAIRTGGYVGAGFEQLIAPYVGSAVGQGARESSASPTIGYDVLDEFIDGLLAGPPLPPLETVEREPEMVFYQKTPARIVFELVAKARLTPADVFCDIGAGLGQVPLLVHLLSGAPATGIELDPAYCAYATASAAALHLPNVTFHPTDARAADYSTGTVFFMYTPFAGRILQDVLHLLQAEARHRVIRLFSYGPCTPHVAGQPWLHCADPAAAADIYRLVEFRSE